MERPAMACRSLGNMLGLKSCAVVVQAEPLAQEIVQTRLTPAAEAIAEQAVPQAERFNEEVIRPRGQQLAEQVMVELDSVAPVRLLCSLAPC